MQKQLGPALLFFHGWIFEWIDSDSLAGGNVSHREHRKQSCTINRDYSSSKKIYSLSSVLIPPLPLSQLILCKELKNESYVLAIQITRDSTYAEDPKDCTNHCSRADSWAGGRDVRVLPLHLSLTALWNSSLCCSLSLWLPVINPCAEWN